MPLTTLREMRQTLQDSQRKLLIWRTRTPYSVRLHLTIDDTPLRRHRFTICLTQDSAEIVGAIELLSRRLAVREATTMVTSKERWDVMKPHMSDHSSGEKHIYTPSGTKVIATQAGIDLLYGKGFRDKVIASATSTKKN